MPDRDDADLDTPAHVRFVATERAAVSQERFDRIGFAMRALRIVRPPGMTVAVLEGRSRLHTDTGRDLRHGAGRTWGILAIPPHASRADIAIAVASLAGRTNDPYLIDVILAHDAAKD